MRTWLHDTFELSRGGNTGNLRPMEGLRGFAVLLVFMVHYVSLSQPWLDPQTGFAVLADHLHHVGNAGVDLFFVLSGYLIYGSLIARRQAFGPYMKRRAQRIYPAFLAMFALYLVLSFVFPERSKIPADPGEALVYIAQNLLLLPGLFPIEPIITVAWSLSYEMFFYGLVPLLIGALALRDRTPSGRVTIILALSLMFLLAVAVHGGPVRMLMFVGGMLLYEALPSPRLRTPSAAAAVAATLGALAFTLIPVPGIQMFAVKMIVLCLGFFVLCLACFRDPAAPVARAFSVTPLRWLGNMSYSFYLMHGLALHAGFLILSRVVQPEPIGPLFFWAVLPPMLLLALIASAVLFVLIERPFSLAPATGRRAPGRQVATPETGTS
mgnify:FL=1